MRTVWTAWKMSLDERSSRRVFAMRLANDGLSPCLGPGVSRAPHMRGSWFSAALRGVRRDRGDARQMANDAAAWCDTMLAMSQRSRARGEDDRRRFVADPDVLAALDLTFEQLSDPDVRSGVIRHEHPEFEQALTHGRREIEGGDRPINPRLHLTMHEIVATQLWDDSPPEVWDTAVRLLEAGYERHEVLHMLGRPVSDQVWEALHDKRPYDRERHVAALQALPGSWERERTARTATRRHQEARKQARQAARGARKRNRRPS